MKRLLKKLFSRHEWSILCLFIAVILLFNRCRKEANDIGAVIEVTTVQMQPDIYFHQAITDFSNKDYKNSAKNIRMAINNMDSIALKANEELKLKIKKSIEELSDLQTDVAFDKVDGVEDLNYCFARAGQALAGYHMHIYKTEYYNLKGKQAGEELSKAISFIEGSVAFNDHEFDAEEVALLTDLRKNADLLKHGEEVSKTNIEALVMRLNEHMVKWGNEIEVNYRNFQNSRKTMIHNKI